MVNALLYGAGGSQLESNCAFNLPCPQRLGTALLLGDDIEKYSCDEDFLPSECQNNETSLA